MLQRLFSKIPYGDLCNYVMQRYVTKSLPQTEEKFKKRYANAIRHRETYEKLSSKPIAKLQVETTGEASSLIEHARNRLESILSELEENVNRIATLSLTSTGSMSHTLG